MLVLALMAIQLAAGSSGSGLNMEKIHVQGDTLSYGSYKISRTYDAETKQSRATVKGNGRVLARHSFGEGLEGIEATYFGLFPLLGKNRKQLVVQQYSGGAHCCHSWWIYDLYPGSG
jgi:hypothetical protein